DDGPARLGERLDRAHDRAQGSDRAGPQVIAVTESARQEDRVDVLEVRRSMPQVDGLGVEDLARRLVAVVVAVRAGEGDDADLHPALPASSRTLTSKSSVTGLARSCRHMAIARSSAATALSASRVIWMKRPT